MRVDRLCTGALRGRRAVKWPVALVVGLAAAAVVTSAASAGRPVLRTTGAVWTSSASGGSVSATVYVAAVECTQVHHGQFEGQRAGAELFGSQSARTGTVHPFDFAGYYSYCDGHRAVYEPEFLVSNVGSNQLRFVPAGFGISPADPLEITIERHGAHVTLTITDVNTKRHASVSGPSLGRSYGWAGGVLPLYGTSSGRPYLHGVVPLTDQYSLTGGPNLVAGPVPSAPVVFRRFRADNRWLTPHFVALHSSTWGGTARTGVRVTSPSRGAFEATRRLKSPRVGKSADVTPVSGTTLIQVAGTHHFFKLGKGQQIPNHSTIDTTHGEIQITLGLPGGASETGVFYDGRFRLDQSSRTGEATATLSGGRPQACPLAIGPGANAVTIASAAKGRKHSRPKGKKLRSLWANAHGNYTTKGSGGAAAVLGTKWFTEDTCYGTYFKAVRDSIKVTAYYPTRHTVIVPQGQSIFVPNALPTINVTPIKSSGGRDNVQLSHEYRLVIVSSIRPEYVYASVAPSLPSGGNVPLYADGSVDGVPRWQILFDVTPNLSDFQNWNVGVRIGHQLYVVKLRVK